MTNNRELDNPDLLETEMLKNLRMMTPEARAELLAISTIYAESFPLRPVLRLVQSGSS